MSLGSVGAGLLAGILSTLSPCVLPLLPIILGSAGAADRRGAAWLALGVALSFTSAGLFVAVIGFSIGLDGDVFRSVSAVLLGAIGIVLLSKAVQARLALAIGGVSDVGDRLIRRLSWGGAAGQFSLGVLLGLVWSPCVGPTLGAASILAAKGKNLAAVAAVMFAFGVGTTLPLLAVAALSRRVMSRWLGRALAAGEAGKRVMGAAALLMAGMILTGADRYAEAALVNASPPWLTDLTTYF